MLSDVKELVYRANMQLPAAGLVTLTWGNASGIDRERGFLVIKPSGVLYDRLREEDLVVVDLEGKKVAGRLNPSSDTPTHIELYKRFPVIGGIVHTHSRWATAWAQAGRSIPVYGTTHADTFYGPVPCCRQMSREEVDGAYELESAKVIAEHFEKAEINPLHTPGALLRSHGPFTWGRDALEAASHAVVLEEVALMAARTERIAAALPLDCVPDYLLDRHFERKHGPNAYYGQRDDA